MKTYTYIFCNSKCECFQTGSSSDIEATIKEFNRLDVLCLKPEFRLHVLIHLEVYPDKNEALERMQEIVKLDKQQKEKLIEGSNPNYYELILGQNITL